MQIYMYSNFIKNEQEEKEKESEAVYTAAIFSKQERRGIKAAKKGVIGKDKAPASALNWQTVEEERERRRKMTLAQADKKIMKI